MPEPEAALPSITIQAGVDHLVEVRAFVRANATPAGADADMTADLVQAVDELVCNVIEHGYQGRPGQVEIAFLRTADALVFRLRDDAPPFDPRTVPEPPLDLPLEQRRLGGMGVHLVRTMTDGFDHRILPTGGNEVTVSKLLPIATEGIHDGHRDRPPAR